MLRKSRKAHLGYRPQLSGTDGRIPLYWCGLLARFFYQRTQKKLALIYTFLQKYVLPAAIA